VLQNRGDGSYFLDTSYEVGNEPRSLYLGDLDHDIDLDMVTANYRSNDIFVHLNNGAGKFFIDSTYFTGNSPCFVFGGDVDNDGDIDLAVANFDDKTVSIFKNENSIQTNYPPETPLLIIPQHGSFISESKPNLAWQVPADRNGDSLHFRVELNSDSSWIFDSFINPTGFNPPPPVKQGVGTVTYLLQQNLPDGRYEWRVTARDQNTYGEFSSEWLFTVDTSPPIIDSLVISSPDFFPNWFNQNNTSVIELLVYYDEIHAKNAKLESGVLNDLSVKDSIKSGFNQIVKFFIDIAKAEDGVYWIVSIIQDSANNTARDSLQVQLDSTPPTSITATSFVDTSASTSFIITWEKATDSGSGVSGYDVRVKVDDSVWQDWLLDSPVTETVYFGEHGHRYLFEARARDNVGNVEPFTAIAEAQVFVDTTMSDLIAPSAPLNLVAGGANPSPWQKDAIFRISWTNPPDPSAIWRSLYKIGTAPTSNDDTTGTATGIPPFDVVATHEDGQELYLWLEDGQGNVDFWNHSRVAMRYDATPPVIDSLVALAPDFAPNWYNQDSTEVVKIRIYYDEAHAAGASLAAGGLGDPDESSDIPSGVEQIVEFDINVANDPDGNYQIQATLHDSAGNQGLSSTLLIKLDATPPVITHVPQILISEGQPIMINSIMKDNNRIHQARLYYRKGGESTYGLLPMDSQDDTTFHVTIPGHEVASRGIDYFLMATDGLSVSHSPTFNWETSPHQIQVRIIGENNQGLVNNSPQPGGSEQKAFRMISLPLIIDNPKPDAVLEDDLGPYNRKKWRLFHYNTQSGTYDEFPGTDEFYPGKAFWLIVKDHGKTIDSGIGTSVPSDTPFVIPLQPGWNDIANPFNFTIDWNKIAVSSGNIQDIMGPYTYEDRWLIPSEIVTILPWQGYSVYTEYNDLSLIIPPIESSHGLNKSLWSPFSDVQWQLILEATCQQAQDAANIIGCSEQASAEWDKKDYLEPPPIGSYVSLLFPHDKWDRYPGCYTTDFRPGFNMGETWDFKIKTNIEHSEVKLRILNSQAIPSRYKVMVYDISGYQKINISDTSFYSFKSHRNVSVRSFKLVIGNPEFINEVEGELPLAPGNFHLAQNYPNPFNLGTQIQYQLPQTTRVNLKIFNILGQEIKTLVHEEQETGYYKIQWNGKDDYNRDVGTGIYILRMKAGDFVQT
ncbi:MAG: T9SS type A sorting domain-containing protein, partial [bacterium]